MPRADCLFDQLTGSRLIFRNTQRHFFIFFIWFRIVVLIDILETCSCRFCIFRLLLPSAKFSLLHFLLRIFNFWGPALLARYIWVTSHNDYEKVVTHHKILYASLVGVSGLINHV